MTKPRDRRGASLSVLTTGAGHGLNAGDVVRLRAAGRPAWWRRMWSLRSRPWVRYVIGVRRSSVTLCDRPATNAEWLREFINVLRGNT